MEPKTDNRKTFRLDDDAANSLAKLKNRHATENAAINHALVQWPKDIARLEEQKIKLSEAGNAAMVDARTWKAKFEGVRDELDDVKKSLLLVGKLLTGTE